MNVLSLLYLFGYALFITNTTSIKENNFNYLRTTVMRDQYSEESNETEIQWDYGCDSCFGPSEWGEQSSDWVLCSNGTEQSPIRILSFDVAKDLHTTYLQTMYHPASATLINDGNLVKLKWKGGSLYIDGILYELYEIRFHTPSEHSINGKIYPLEMQMMHRDLNNGGMAILAILFKIDEKLNTFLDQFWPYIPTFQWNQAVDITYVNPSELDLNGKSFYWYRGSLTTPPCTQGVMWAVIKKIYKVSSIQLDLLHAALERANSRPVQSLNARSVYKGKLI